MRYVSTPPRRPCAKKRRRHTKTHAHTCTHTQARTKKRLALTQRNRGPSFSFLFPLLQSNKNVPDGRVRPKRDVSLSLSLYLNYVANSPEDRTRSINHRRRINFGWGGGGEGSPLVACWPTTVAARAALSSLATPNGHLLPNYVEH